MVSLKDIAAACGVSVATVSKALNGQKEIGEQTRKRIVEAAAQMGYQPNTAARALKTKKTWNIGVLFSDGDNSGLTHNYFSHVLDSFKRTAEDRGYDITFINRAGRGKKTMTWLEHARSRGFDGVVIACIDFTSPEVAELVNSEIPVVTIDYVFHNCMAVLSNNNSGMTALMQYIIGMGHRRIAYLHGERESMVTGARLTAFYRAAEAAGIPVPDEYVREARYRGSRECYELTEKLLSLPEPPTCILYPDDFAAFGGMNCLREKGLQVPEDISIAGYDGISLTRYLEPKLTTLVQSSERIGACAAEKLISLLEKPKTTLIETTLIDGKVQKGGTVKRL